MIRVAHELYCTINIPYELYHKHSLKHSPFVSCTVLQAFRSQRSDERNFGLSIAICGWNINCKKNKTVVKLQLFSDLMSTKENTLANRNKLNNLYFKAKHKMKALKRELIKLN